MYQNGWFHLKLFQDIFHHMIVEGKKCCGESWYTQEVFGIPNFSFPLSILNLNV